MKMNIKATGIEITPAISNYVQKKIFSIEKYLPARIGADKKNTGVVAQVEIGKSTHHHKAGNIFRAEVHIVGTSLDLYAVSETEDLYAAIDLVKDEITRNAVQLKSKRLTLARKSAEMMKNMIKGLSDNLSDNTAKIRRLAGSWSIDRLKFKNFKKRP